MGYQLRIDPRAEVTRKQLRQISIRDLDGMGRWHLHMSEEELSYLECNNPGFDMNKFVASPGSRPFKVSA